MRSFGTVLATTALVLTFVSAPAAAAPEEGVFVTTDGQGLGAVPRFPNPELSFLYVEFSYAFVTADHGDVTVRAWACPPSGPCANLPTEQWAMGDADEGTVIFGFHAPTDLSWVLMATHDGDEAAALEWRATALVGEDAASTVGHVRGVLLVAA